MADPRDYKGSPHICTPEACPLVQRLEPKLDDVAKAVGKLTREITGNGGVGLAERVRANARRLDERDRLRV